MSPRTQEANQLIREDRRNEILKAALKVFARRGLAATKIADIAEEAKMSYGLVYHYFDCKEAIFHELIKGSLESSINIYKDLTQLSGSPIEKLKIVTERVIPNAYTEYKRYNFLIMIDAMVSLDILPVETKLYIAEKEPLRRKYLTPIFLEGQEVGDIIEGNPHQLVTVYFSIIQGLALLYLNENFPTAEMVINIFKREK